MFLLKCVCRLVFFVEIEFEIRFASSWPWTTRERSSAGSRWGWTSTSRDQMVGFHFNIHLIVLYPNCSFIRYLFAFHFQMKCFVFVTFYVLGENQQPFQNSCCLIMTASAKKYVIRRFALLLFLQLLKERKFLLLIFCSIIFNGKNNR